MRALLAEGDEALDGAPQPEGGEGEPPVRGVEADLEVVGLVDVLEAVGRGGREPGAGGVAAGVEDALGGRRPL